MNAERNRKLWDSPVDIINTYGLYRWVPRRGKGKKKKKKTTQSFDNLNPGNLFHLYSLTPKK